MTFDRRTFVGQMLLYGAFAQVASLSAQTPQQKEDKKDEKPVDPFNPNGDSKSTHEKTYTDKDGNQYRICPQCGFNMYKQGRMWVCENCGYSYVE